MSARKVGLLFAALLAGKIRGPGDNLVVENIPAIPLEIAEKANQYGEFRAAALQETRALDEVGLVPHETVYRRAAEHGLKQGPTGFADEDAGDIVLAGEAGRLGLEALEGVARGQVVGMQVVGDEFRHAAGIAIAE